MRGGRRPLLGAALAGVAAPSRAGRLVGDATGRRIAVPDGITRVFPAGPPAARRSAAADRAGGSGA